MEKQQFGTDEGLAAYRAWQWWLTQPSGHALARCETRLADSLLGRINAQALIQIGSSPRWMLPVSTTDHSCLHRTSSTTSAAYNNINIACAEDQLAILSQSYQVAILPHTLDWRADRKEVLGEAWRILQPGGLCLAFFYHRSTWLHRAAADRSFRAMINAMPPLSYSQAKKNCSQAGFTTVCCRGMLPLTTKRARALPVPPVVGLSQLIILKKQLLELHMKTTKGRRAWVNVPNPYAA